MRFIGFVHSLDKPESKIDLIRKYEFDSNSRSQAETKLELDTLEYLEKHQFPKGNYEIDLIEG